MSDEAEDLRAIRHNVYDIRHGRQWRPRWLFAVVFWAVFLGALSALTLWTIAMYIYTKWRLTS